MRATKDMDIWIRCDPGNAQKVWQSPAKFGVPMDQISVADLRSPNLIYQIGIPPRRIDLLTGISGVTFDLAWKESLPVEIEGLKVRVIGKQQLIANKVSAGRPQDLVDADKLKRRP